MELTSSTFATSQARNKAKTAPLATGTVHLLRPYHATANNSNELVAAGTIIITLWGTCTFEPRHHHEIKLLTMLATSILTATVPEISTQTGIYDSTDEDLISNNAPPLRLHHEQVFESWSAKWIRHSKMCWIWGILEPHAVSVTLFLILFYALQFAFFFLTQANVCLIVKCAASFFIGTRMGAITSS